MPIAVSCANCKKRINAADKFAGKRVKCPACGTPIAVPAAGGDSPPAAPQPAQPRPATQAKAPRAATKSKTSAGAARAPSATAASPTVWYVLLADGRQTGPLTRDQLDQQVAAGQVDRQCQLWKNGWPAARWASELYPALAAPPAPAPVAVAPVQGLPPPGLLPGVAPAEYYPMPAPGMAAVPAYGPMLGALPPLPPAGGDNPYVTPAAPRKRRRRGSGPLELSPWAWALVGLGTALLLMAGLSLLLPPLGVACFVLLLLAGGATVMAGNIWGIVVAFQESVETGLLYLFVPFYSLYYLITRWDEAYQPFLLALLGVGLVLAGLGMLMLASLGMSLWAGALQGVQ